MVDESLKYVEAGVNLVSEDVQELSQAIVEDTQARFSNRLQIGLDPFF